MNANCCNNLFSDFFSYNLTNDVESDAVLTQQPFLKVRYYREKVTAALQTYKP